MCFKSTCSTCGKKTWWGCGLHISKPFAGVPAEQWCTCEPKVKFEGEQYPPKGPGAD